LSLTTFPSAGDDALGREKPVEERPIARQALTQFFRGDFLALGPLLLEALRRPRASSRSTAADASMPLLTVSTRPSGLPVTTDFVTDEKFS